MSDTSQTPPLAPPEAPVEQTPAPAPAVASSTLPRRLLLGGVGVVAALAGLGLYHLGERLSSGSGPEPGDAAAVNALWAMQWDTPQGTVLPMADFKGKPLLINFWATWCPPCVEELPLLNAFYRTHKAAGWQVLGLAVDRLSAVKSFLQRFPLDFPVGMAGLDGSALGKSLGNISESLPFSVALGAGGQVLQRKLGQLSEEDLTRLSGLK